MQIDQVPSRWAFRTDMAAAIAVNAIPIFGVLFGGWSAFALIFLYWLENVVIGGRTLLSIIASGLAKGWPAALGLLFVCPFFIFHYGMFCTVHGLFVVLLFGPRELNHVVQSPFDMAGIANAVFGAQPHLAIAFAAMCLWHLGRFLFWLARGEASRSNPLEEMGAPYGRIVVLHIAIMGGGFILMGLGWPIGGVLALAGLKTLYDIDGVIRSHKQRGGPPSLAEAFKSLRVGRGQPQSPAASPPTGPSPPTPPA